MEPLEDRYLLSRSFGPWGEAVSLGPTINTPHLDGHPAISKDGRSLYFTSDRPGGFGGWDIWVSRRADRHDPWGEPVNLGPIINAGGEDHAVTFSRDGRRMFFHSDRPGGFGGTDIYVSYRQNPNDDFGWQTPVNLGPGVNSEYDDGGATYFEDRRTGINTLYFASVRPGGFGDFDIHASPENDDGSFGPAAHIPELNSPFRDTRTAIRRDGLELLITSNRPGGLGGLDVWVSTRASTLDPWSTPVNLGPAVNTPSADGAPALSKDGLTLYFYSNRPGGLGDNDLYVTTRARSRDGAGGQADSSLRIALAVSARSSPGTDVPRERSANERPVPDLRDTPPGGDAVLPGLLAAQAHDGQRGEIPRLTPGEDPDGLFSALDPREGFTDPAGSITAII